MHPESPTTDAAPQPVDPFTEAILRLMPRIRTIARLRLGKQLRTVVSSADIAQSACRQLLEQRGRLEFRGDEAMAALVHTVVVRKIREKARSAAAACRDKRNPDASKDLESLATGEQVNPVHDAIAHERGEIIARSLERLPPRDAEALVLRHVLALSQEEIAAHLGLTLAAVRNLLYRARGRLGASLRRNELGGE